MTKKKRICISLDDKSFGLLLKEQTLINNTLPCEVVYTKSDVICFLIQKYSDEIGFD